MYPIELPKGENEKEDTELDFDNVIETINNDSDNLVDEKSDINLNYVRRQKRNAAVLVDMKMKYMS